jgi:hypothetical protein
MRELFRDTRLRRVRVTSLTPPPQVVMASEEKATSLLPSSQLIKQTLAYAKELERIV